MEEFISILQKAADDAEFCHTMKQIFESLEKIHEYNSRIKSS